MSCVIRQAPCAPAVVILITVLCGVRAMAQAPEPSPPLTIQQAVARALDHYPAVRAATAQADAARATAGLSRDVYLPRADIIWQTNRSTRNNISGLLFPQSVVSAISGPVSASTSDSIWNNAAGVLVAWEPFDFGYRGETVRAALASQRAAAADETVTRLTVSAAAADAFLTVLAADEEVRAANAAVERARVLFDVVNARAQAGLRPGADAARAQAEIASAQTALARAEQRAASARADLARWVGVPVSALRLAGEPFLRTPASTTPPEGRSTPHPRLQAQAARVDAARAAETAAAHTYVPRLFLEGTMFARGAGADPAGAIGATNGFALSARNWAVGVNVTFPLFDAPALRERHAIEIAHVEEQSARYDQAQQDLASDRVRAEAVLTAARRIAALAPAQLDAAQAARDQARARYDSGLGNITDVAETERLLTDSQTDYALAMLGVWRAELDVAVAIGDLSPVLNAAGGTLP